MNTESDDRKNNAAIIGANVARLRKAAGLTQQQLAEKIDVKSQNTIAAIETGSTIKSKHLMDIAAALQVRISDLDPSFKLHETVTVPATKLLGDRNLDVFGTVRVGRDDIVVKTNEPIDVVLRPAPLEHVRGAYGLVVVVDSMVPIVRSGDTVLINPHLPPRLNDLCLFINIVNDRKVHTTLVLKEFRGENADAWQVRHYFPKEKTLWLPKRDWPKCHRVVAVYKG